MMSLRDKDTKQETGNSTKAASSSSRQWSAGIKNPRIVRVSRTFGGKDRHSKVCTVKGLRDRRIRLSVPTAIQLYDLQDRLGLSQPSKVIDWLLDTTKNDIDKLPPLPNIPGGFAPFHHGGRGPQSSSSSTPFLDANLIPLRKQCININSHVDEEDHDQQSLVAKFKYWDSNSNSMINMRSSKQKEVDHDHQGGMGELTNSTTNSQVLAQNFFPIARGNIINTSVLPPPPTLLSSNPMFNYYHWEPNSNLSLTQLGSHGLPSQNHDHHSNSSTLPSSLSLSSGSQLFLYPSMSTTSMFPPPHASNFMNTHHQIIENELRQYNNRSFNLSNPISLSDLHNSSSLGLNHNQPHLHQNQDEGDHRRS